MSEFSAGHNRLRGLDPEYLLSVDATDIPLLMAHHYGFLVDHGADLNKQAKAWLKGTGINDDAEWAAASELYAKLRDHAGISGAVEATRKRVKSQPAMLINAVDTWFGDLRAELLMLMQHIDVAQRTYAEAKVARERAAREAVAAKAKSDAEQLAAMARAPDAPDAMVDAAMGAEFQATVAAMDAKAGTAALSRVRSAETTTSVSTRWDFRLLSLREVCEGVIAGSVPLDFLMLNDTAVAEAVRGKRGRRHVPGLEIFEVYGINRRRG